MNYNKLSVEVGPVRHFFTFHYQLNYFTFHYQLQLQNAKF